MKTLKGIAQDIKGLVSGEKTTYHAVAQDAEFEDLFQRYKDLPDWIAQLNPQLQQSVTKNHEAAHHNADHARAFLRILDDERSGEKPRQLAESMHDEIHKWQLYDTSDRSPINKAQSLIGKLHSLAVQTNADIESRERVSGELGRILTDLDEMHKKIAEKGAASVKSEQLNQKEIDKSQVETRYNEMNVRAKQNMWKVIELTPRIVYLTLYGYAQWCADTLGFRPMIWAADPLQNAHAELKDTNQWDTEKLHGMSIQDIFNFTTVELTAAQAVREAKNEEDMVAGTRTEEITSTETQPTVPIHVTAKVTLKPTEETEQPEEHVERAEAGAA